MTTAYNRIAGQSVERLAALAYLRSVKPVKHRTGWTTANGLPPTERRL